MKQLIAASVWNIVFISIFHFLGSVCEWIWYDWIEMCLILNAVETKSMENEYEYEWILIKIVNSSAFEKHIYIDRA